MIFHRPTFALIAVAVLGACQARDATPPINATGGIETAPKGSVLLALKAPGGDLVELRRNMSLADVEDLIGEADGPVRLFPVLHGDGVEACYTWAVADEENGPFIHVIFLNNRLDGSFPQRSEPC